MKTTATIRELRNQFPKIRKLIETEGEVVLTEKGKPRYRLTLYTAINAQKPGIIDYWKRLNAYQPVELTPTQSRALNDANRGDR